MLYVVSSEPPTHETTNYLLWDCNFFVLQISLLFVVNASSLTENVAWGVVSKNFFGDHPPPTKFSFGLKLRGRSPLDPPLALAHFCRMTGVIVSSKSYTVLQSRPRPTGSPKYPTKTDSHRGVLLKLYTFWHKKGIIIFNSPLMLPDTSITNAMEFSDFKFRNFAKMSSPTVERMSLRNMLVASIARSAAILCKLKKKTNRRKKKRGNTFN